MAFKGKSTIELRNAETGELEQRVEDENMVTNAAYNLINGFNEINSIQWIYLPKNQFVPLLSNCFGGLRLFQNSIQEDENNILIPENNRIVGRATKTYVGSDTTRGTLNTAESKEINDGKGYRYVWDFPTDKGNGTIRSVCLTSEKGGGDSLVGRIGSGLLDDGNGIGFSASIAPQGAGNMDCIGYFRAKEFLFANNSGGSTATTFKSFRFETKMTLKTNSEVSITEKTVTSNLQLCESKKFQQVGTNIYSIYPYDTNKIDVVIFDGITQEIVSEQTYTFQDATFYMIKDTSYGEKNSLYFDGFFYVVGTRNDHDGKIYERVYKINPNDLSDYSIVEILLGEGNYNGFLMSVIGAGILINSICNTNYYATEYSYVFDGINLYSYNIPISTKLSSFGVTKFCVSPFLKAPYLISLSKGKINFHIWAPFLSTINNLSTPVVKNETQTMKVTYEITEV